jgi:hypothetical protein
MKRPLKPVVQTEEERKRERRFTRRMMLLAIGGCIVGMGVNAVVMTRTMGRPPSPPPPPGIPPPPTVTYPVAPPRLRGK